MGILTQRWTGLSLLQAGLHGFSPYREPFHAVYARPVSTNGLQYYSPGKQGRLACLQRRQGDTTKHRR